MTLVKKSISFLDIKLTNKTKNKKYIVNRAKIFVRPEVSLI